MTANDLANNVVGEYCLRDYFFQEKRANGCGCRSCISDFETAVDRQNWFDRVGEWLRKPKPRRFMVRSGRVVSTDSSRVDEDIQNWFDENRGDDNQLPIG